ncbi:MAG: ribose 5-phosphate isomerase B [Clostridiales bacterium]|nr:ribose 5-phosphate isomerase B [Clostridiales bacterium]
MIIPIASDHAGYKLKEQVKAFLQARGQETLDYGCPDEQSVDYPDYAALVAAGVGAGKYERGILICGTGIGMSIAANKFPGVRAALCHSVFTAQCAREHNNANILALGARVLSAPEALEMVRVWLETPFAGARHAQRLEKISRLEKS